MSVNDPGYSYFRHDERYNAITFDALANASSGTKYHLGGSEGGLVTKFQGPHAQCLARALDSFAAVTTTTQLAFWTCHWVVVIGFLVVDRLAWMSSGTQTRKSSASTETQAAHDSGLPDSGDVLDAAGSPDLP